ncbi:MAG: phage tail protein [Clostridia bacterium]|nr:phage tail protein [Clostridia bacterium]
MTEGIAELIHHERKHTLSAEIKTDSTIASGDYLGIKCVDGRFRLFCVDIADESDEDGTTEITATDAAVDELAGTIITRENGTSVKASEAVAAIASAAGWAIGTNEAGSKTADRKEEILDAWSALEEIEKAYGLYAAPYYVFQDGEIVGRRIDVLAKTPVYRGRLVESGVESDGIVVTRSSRPRPKIYPVGNGSLTIADVVWTKAAGKPVDKPKGQKWIGVPEAVEQYLGRGQTLSLPDVEDAEKLAQAAWEKAQAATKPEITATASICDMEMAAGQDWKSIRIFDVIRIRTRRGEDVEEQVTDIDRNYTQPERTKIILGKEPETSSSQVKQLKEESERHGRGVAGNQTMLRDTLVTVEELDSYTKTTISDVYVKLNAAEAAIELRATREEVAENDAYYTRRFSEAFMRLDAAEGEIELRASIEEVEGVKSNLSRAIIRLDAAEGQIQLKASKSAVDELTEEVKEVSLELDAANEEIRLRAKYIDLEGYVTIGEFEAELAKINRIFAGTATAAKIIVANLTALAMTFDGLKCKWQYLSVPYSGRIPELQRYIVRLADGETATLYAHPYAGRSIDLYERGYTFMMPTT